MAYLETSSWHTNVSPK